MAVPTSRPTPGGGGRSAVLCLSLLIVFGGNSTLNVALPDARRATSAPPSRSCSGWSPSTRSCSPACCSRPARSATGSAARARSSSGSATFFVASRARVAGHRRHADHRLPRRDGRRRRVHHAGDAVDPRERVPAPRARQGDRDLGDHDRRRRVGRSRHHRLGARPLLVRLRVPRVPPGDRGRVRRRLVLRAEVARPERERASTRSARCSRSSGIVGPRLRLHRGARQGLGAHR